MIGSKRKSKESKARANRRPKKSGAASAAAHAARKSACSRRNTDRRRKRNDEVRLSRKWNSGGISHWSFHAYGLVNAAISVSIQLSPWLLCRSERERFFEMARNLFVEGERRGRPLEGERLPGLSQLVFRPHRPWRFSHWRG